jgi:hypothetical protein
MWDYVPARLVTIHLSGGTAGHTGKNAVTPASR